MPKFVYLGKTVNFKLDEVYNYKKELNNGDTFELDDNDSLLLIRAIEIAADSDGSPPDFMFEDAHKVSLLKKNANKKKEAYEKAINLENEKKKNDERKKAEKAKLEEDKRLREKEKKEKSYAKKNT